jgi:hypothetical protein
MSRKYHYQYLGQRKFKLGKETHSLICGGKGSSMPAVAIRILFSVIISVALLLILFHGG